MKLYKNIDVCDLESISAKGILSLNESGNNNWEQGKRVNNSSDVVYLFKPTGKANSFPNYGIILAEVEVPDEDVTLSQLSECDVHRNDYEEYLADKVLPSQIIHFYIPAIFKHRLNVDNEKVVWCDMTADLPISKGVEIVHGIPMGIVSYEEWDSHSREVFSKTASIEKSNTYNFFRGTYENREVFDVYNVRYDIGKDVD